MLKGEDQTVSEMVVLRIAKVKSANSRHQLHGCKRLGQEYAIWHAIGDPSVRAVSSHVDDRKGGIDIPRSPGDVPSLHPAPAKLMSVTSAT